MPASPLSLDRPVAALWHRPGEHGVIIRTPLIGTLAEAVMGWLCHNVSTGYAGILMWGGARQ